MRPRRGLPRRSCRLEHNQSHSLFFWVGSQIPCSTSPRCAQGQRHLYRSGRVHRERQPAYTWRACFTISTNTSLVCDGSLTSRKKATRVPFTPSWVFRRRWKPRRSTEVISASCASMPANRLASRMSASFMVGIHVLHDVALALNQRIGLRLGVIQGSHPSHYPEAAHVINVQYIHFGKRRNRQNRTNTCHLGNACLANCYV